MEYKLLNKESLANVKAAYEERCADWTLEQFQRFVETYKIEVVKLNSNIKLKELGIKRYQEDSTILNPVFAYEKNVEYADTLRDLKMPVMKAELNEELAKLEATVYQIELAEYTIEHFDERVVKAVNEEVTAEKVE
jgi:hypothetical protein